MKIFEHKSQCSGCTACVHICPTQAIIMKHDSEGFVYPRIDKTKCVECGLCRQICPFHEKYDRGGALESPIVYGVKHKDENVRFSSSSGGFFTALSDYVLNKNGVVYGVAFDETFRVVHRKAESYKDRDCFKGSKYVQSELGNIFLDVKRELDKDRNILFTGTPCQIAGLKAFLKNRDYKNLFLCDVVCHGVPSPLIWQDFVTFIEKKYELKLLKFNFREKGKGWHNNRLFAQFASNLLIYDEPSINSFNTVFFQHVALRPSCHSCVFSNFVRPSDITMGDFWGIEKFHPEFDDNKGVSLVLVNSKKGEAIFEQIKPFLEYKQSSMVECMQRPLANPAIPSNKRDAFWEDFEKNGFEYVAKRYTDYGLVNRFKHRVLKPILSKLGILNFVKKVL